MKLNSGYSISQKWFVAQTLCCGNPVSHLTWHYVHAPICLNCYLGWLDPCQHSKTHVQNSPSVWAEQPDMRATQSVVKVIRPAPNWTMYLPLYFQCSWAVSKCDSFPIRKMLMKILSTELQDVDINTFSLSWALMLASLYISMRLSSVHAYREIIVPNWNAHNKVCGTN